MLDAFDVMLYALVLSALMADIGLSMGTAGLLASLTLLASAAGGIGFGFVADRYGRTRALTISILLYSILTGACGLAQTVTQLAIFRVLLGLGMGGEWASGAALVSETWPARHRGKALGFVQSAWAIGYAAAALLTAVLLPRFGWRAVFFAGVAPALFTLWIRRNVDEPAIWKERSAAPSARLSDFLGNRLLGLTIAITLMNACTMYAWWGLNLWIPTYLSRSLAKGGIGLSPSHVSTLVLVVMQVGMWFGYVSFGFISDRFGRKRTYVSYLVLAAILLFVYARVNEPVALLVLGPLVAFVGTGYFSGFGALTAEIYPTEIRATAQGFTYNIGRVASAAAPWVVGKLAETHGFALAFSTAAAAFLIAALLWQWIPETRGRELT
jgi:MFS family permease